ncbi:HIT domain-containing protein [Ruania alkalisoli]|uniref:HIT domain-containing protein n=1 Tax=Ruania alkalisoli TaxID=2779775 RepID=A0A7M1SNU0_9MICO|nr:HIT domain-containing protein [Ruania alkalisoli]QOR69091.1 HIT domain-containing protein [Ruania alkalisoli]
MAGVPDGYDRLWTPHRMAYIGGESKPVDDRPGPGCPFCAAPEGDDETALIVHRGHTCYVVLNLYPYNPGHLLVCPYRHVPDLVAMNRQERAELIELTEAAMVHLRAAKAPDGFNLGMNAGEVAGAGVAAHAHQHIVPRWRGDANFLPIVGRAKAVPELLADTRRELAQQWGSDSGSR